MLPADKGVGYAIRVGVEELQYNVWLGSRVEARGYLGELLDGPIYEVARSLVPLTIRHSKNPLRDLNTSLQTIRRAHQPPNNFFDLCSRTSHHQRSFSSENGSHLGRKVRRRRRVPFEVAKEGEEGGSRGSIAGELVGSDLRVGFSVRISGMGVGLEGLLRWREVRAGRRRWTTEGSGRLKRKEENGKCQLCRRDLDYSQRRRRGCSILLRSWRRNSTRTTRSPEDTEDRVG